MTFTNDGSKMYLLITTKRADYTHISAHKEGNLYIIDVKKTPTLFFKPYYHLFEITTEITDYTVRVNNEDETTYTANLD